MAAILPSHSSKATIMSPRSSSDCDSDHIKKKIQKKNDQESKSKTEREKKSKPMPEPTKKHKLKSSKVEKKQKIEKVVKIEKSKNKPKLIDIPLIPRSKKTSGSTKIVKDKKQDRKEEKIGKLKISLENREHLEKSRSSDKSAKRPVGRPKKGKSNFIPPPILPPPKPNKNKKHMKKSINTNQNQTQSSKNKGRPTSASRKPININNFKITKIKSICWHTSRKYFS